MLRSPAFGMPSSSDCASIYAHTVFHRKTIRQQMDEVAAEYEAFGRGSCRVQSYHTAKDTVAVQQCILQSEAVARELGRAGNNTSHAPDQNAKGLQGFRGPWFHAANIERPARTSAHGRTR